MEIKYTDHDLLVRLDSKFDYLAQQVKDIQDNLSSRILILEKKADENELYHAAFPKDLPLWTEKFRDNFKIVLAFITLAAGIIGGIAEKLVTSWFHIK